MTKRYNVVSWLCLGCLWLGLFAPSASADETLSGRTVIHSQVKSALLAATVEQIIKPTTKIVPDIDLKPSNVYFRLTQRKFVLDQAGVFSENSHLGGSPYVFATVPQIAYGRSLYGIYSDLGYDAESVLRQRGVAMAALVFRYDDRITLSDVRDGDLTAEDYRSFVYVPTWPNAFSLFALLASEPPAPDGGSFDSLQFNSESDRNLARFFPRGHRLRVATLPYDILRAAGGPNWQYRQLLENQMAMNPHFRGVGRTENTLSPADSRKGAPEFVGPNRELKNLSEYAVIDMGRLEFVEAHD